MEWEAFNKLVQKGLSTLVVAGVIAMVGSQYNDRITLTLHTQQLTQIHEALSEIKAFNGRGDRFTEQDGRYLLEMIDDNRGLIKECANRISEVEHQCELHKKGHN